MKDFTSDEQLAKFANALYASNPTYARRLVSAIKLAESDQWRREHIASWEDRIRSIVLPPVVICSETITATDLKLTLRAAVHCNCSINRMSAFTSLSPENFQLRLAALEQLGLIDCRGNVANFNHEAIEEYEAKSIA